jgi:diguanylate cyclase (GGDEF)-like protein/PAS domain S-box-containing protein
MLAELQQDERRIEALLLYGVLDTPAEADFDDITALAARYFDVPIALISLIDRDRQWFKSRVGLDVTQTSRDIAFCDTAIKGSGVMVVPDARSDARFAANPLVTGEPGIRFYAGSPLVTPQGHSLGTLCIIDRKPRAFTAEQGVALTVLSRQVAAHLELRRQKAELARAVDTLRVEHERLKWARSQLEESDARMRLVLKGSNDGWWDRNLQTGRMFFSTRGWEMLGYANEELPYDEHLWERLIFPEDLAATNHRLAELLKSGVENYAVELRLLHKDGRAVPVLCRGYVLRDAAGRAIRMSGTNTDQTDSRAVARALRAEQELNEQIVRNSPIGICIYDGDGNCIIANDAIAEQVGATVEQLRAQNLHHIEAWKTSGIYRQAIHTLETGEPSSRVVHFQTSFGRNVWLSVGFRVLVTGDLGRLMLMTDDLSEFKVADAARREMQEAYSLLFSNGIDGVLQTRSDGAILSVNPAACTVLDLPEATVRARGLAAIVDAQDPRWPALLAERSRSGRARGEVTLLRGNGEHFDAEITTAAYEDREGQALISIMIRDITERQVWARKLEQSLNLLNNLAQRVPGVIYQFQLFPDGRACFPFASDGLWTIYEVTPDEVRADAGPVFRRLHPDDAEAIRLSIAESAASLAPWNAEYRVILPTQGLRWREGNAQPERLADGSVLWHGCIMDVTARKEAQASTHRLAYFDALTGLPNRAYLLDRVAQSLAAARRSGQCGALMFLDLDNFKHINDARGHSVGDALLRQVAQRLGELLRPADVVARLGGDEFVVLVNELGADVDTAALAAMAVAERIRSVLEQPYPIDGHLYSGTGSIGLTMFPKGADGVDDLLREADTAMYRAKSGGRNRIAYFEAAMQAEVEDRLAIEQDLKYAIANTQLHVHVQPQFDAGGVEIGGECLLRWNHPTRGAIAPVYFIPIAEDSGLIRDIGEWVVRQACEAIAALQAAAAAGSPGPDLQRLSLSVNISPRQFRQDDFVERIAALLEETGAPGRCLIFEVTEGLLIDNWEAAAGRMRQIALLGIRFSIDDFGTGYSSLAYLKQLPLHELKIDRSFVKDTPDDPNDTAIVRSILSVARILNLRVVAEGVETQAQADFLVANHCDCLQGYLLARPMPMEAWLTRHGLPPGAQGIS